MLITRSAPRRFALLLTVSLFPSGAAAQEHSPGFTLYTPVSSTNTVITEESGTNLHTWSSTSPAGLAVYQDHNGDILRAEHPPGAGGGPGGGAGGRVRRIGFDGTVEWTFDYFSGGVLHHHDIEPMPNGNVLLVAWEQKTQAEAVAEGRNPANTASIFWPDHIIEVEPTGVSGGNIVWEWHAWDHLIQDFDVTKNNFGVVADHPELIDINYPPGFDSDWTHVNSVDYHPEFDQILLSIHDLDEIWVIDHSTTTAEAAGHTGGNSGMGGDLLYRWGAPAAYGAAGASMLGGQHDANWVEPGYPGEGNITIFNNFAGGGPFSGWSSVIEIEPPVDGSGNYALTPGAAYGPAAPIWEYTAPVQGDLFSSIMSGAIRLANGNTLICSATQGWIFEVTDAGDLVWERTGLGQVFKARRYERSLWADAESISTSAGGIVDFDMVAGTPESGELYVLLGSATGTAPGFPIGGMFVPLTLDAYTVITIKSAGGSLFPGSAGNLDGLGKSSASLDLPAGIATSLAGTTLYHAYIVLDPGTLLLSHVSNAVPLDLLP